MKQKGKGEVYTEVVLEVFKVNGALVNTGDELVKGIGLTSARWKVLGALALSDEPMTVAKIAHKMGQTRQGVQRLTDIMEREGYLKYHENPQHKKAKLVVLTDAGRDLYGKADAIQVKWAKEMSADLTSSELEAALKVLRKIYSNLRG